MQSHFLRILPVFCLLNIAFAEAQSTLFASYDCREHAVDALKKETIHVDFSDLDHQIEIFSEELAFQIHPESNFWQSWTVNENFKFDKDRGELLMIADLNALHPYFRDRVAQLIKICKRKGIELAIVETYRTHAKQHEYKTMGKKFTSSGAGRSKHQYGLAVDLVPIINGKAEWHNKVLWKKIGVVGESLGLRWGGRWRHPFDPGHFEYTSGLTSSDLAGGKEPYVPNKDKNYPCIEEDLSMLSKFWEAWETEQASMARLNK